MKGRRNRERLRRGVARRDVEVRSRVVELQFAASTQPRAQVKRAKGGRQEAEHDRRELAVLGVAEVNRERGVAERRHPVATDDRRAAGAIADRGAPAEAASAESAFTSSAPVNARV